MDTFPSPIRPASSLADACNDTGRTAFCGPYVLAAITGYPISKIEDVIRDARNTRRKTVVKGTGADEVEAALAAFGYTMTLKQNFMNRPRKERPTLWNWMQKPRNVWAHYIPQAGHSYLRLDWVTALPVPQENLSVQFSSIFLIFVVALQSNNKGYPSSSPTPSAVKVSTPS